VRLFVALELGEAIRQAVRELIARLEPASPDARWVRPEGMHVTLKFIGQAPPEKLDAIRSALSAIRSPEPVELRFRGIGFFPNEKRPRVIWCGMEASRNLAALAADIERALEPLGIAAESRDFIPHLTLARWSRPAQVGELARTAAKWRSHTLGSGRETEFYLFESVLKPAGAEYRKLARYRFVEGAL
jgi:RNA 2',3'-cyclic 3'-phosphodiesterase